jgi:hypothetical protein
MKTIDLAENHTSVADLLRVAKQESVVLRSVEGDEFFLAWLDDFEKEVESLRQNKKFMEFLDARGQETETISLEEVKRRLGI